MTPIYYIDSIKTNKFYIKREDLIPFSFGGNKARKAELFFKAIDKGGFNCVVTYGTGSSNHCRVIANHCSSIKLPCYIISPEERTEQTYNSQMMRLFKAEIDTAPISSVHSKIESKLNELKMAGKKPYFIEGGGHGNIGTEAYVQCYREIQEHEKNLGVRFDYVFFASGTGTTQAGLVCGQLLSGDEKKIVGISISRENPRGRDIVINSIRSYLGQHVDESAIQDKTIFIDAYADKYGQYNDQILETIVSVIRQYGVHMDMIYTGKAFWGMMKYIEKEEIHDSNILFIHTGGTPLFFDVLKIIN